MAGPGSGGAAAPPEDPAPPVAALTARSAGVTVAAQSVARAITLAVVVVSTALVARELTLERYADWVTILSLVTLAAVLLDPGLSPAVVRRLAQQHTDAPTPAALRRVRLALGLLTLAVVTAGSVALRGTGALLLALALGGQIVARADVLNATPFLQTDHRLHRQTALEAVTAALGLAALAVAVAAGTSAEVMALAGFTVPAFVLAALVRGELRRTPSASVPPPGPQRARVRSIAREVAPLAAALLLTTAYTRLFTVFLNAAEDAADVARYLFAFQFVEQVIVVAGIVGGALLPIIAVRGRTVRLVADDVVHELTVAMAAVGAIVAGALVASAPVLCRAIGGPKLAAADRYLELVAPLSALIFVAFVLGYVYIAMGRGAAYLRFNAAALAFNLAANAALTLTVGASATARVAWATELIVVTLAFAPLARASASGRATAVRVAAIVAVAVTGAELAGGDVLAPAVAGVLVAAAAAALAAGPLRRFAGAVLRPGRS
ncbi:MAG TPA: oligosaccharide flippase family protein [Solirubrobacteraceae bacterium]|jgi:O-antigen/teichoic acid export membrane protein|nr:oligosaccharide flippase family protein [Solirubrobacteraceae bacterium]